MRKTCMLVLLLLAVLLPALLGIFHSGFFVTDDGNWMVIRLSAFYEAFRQGQFPVRYLPRLNNGYGYPVADFLYPLYLYLGAGIHILHINFVTTVKILFGISLFASALGSFFWLRKQFGDVASFVGAIVYALFPYHVWDITKRGSLGEVLAMAVVPFIFWQIDAENIAFTALGIGLLILSHNTLALLFLPILIGYMILEKKITHLLLSTGFGIALATFFWLPALFDKQFTIFDATMVSQYSNYFLSSSLYPLIGLVSFFVIILSFLVVYKKVANLPIFFLVISLLSISLTNRVAQPIWQFFHLGTYVQFPFRFLSITALGVGFLAAYSIANWQKKYTLFTALLICVLLFISSWQFFFANNYSYSQDTFYSTNQSTTTVQNEYMPIWVKKPYISKSHVEFSASDIMSMGNVLDKGSSISFPLTISQPTQLTIGKIFFPGWTVMVDGRQQNIQTNTYGFIVVTVPKGKHVITAQFGETKLRLFADVISLITLMLLTLWLFFNKKHTYV